MKSYPIKNYLLRNFRN